MEQERDQLKFVEIFIFLGSEMNSAQRTSEIRARSAGFAAHGATLHEKRFMFLYEEEFPAWTSSHEEAFFPVTGKWCAKARCTGKIYVSGGRA